MDLNAWWQTRRAPCSSTQTWDFVSIGLSVVLARSGLFGQSIVFLPDWPDEQKGVAAAWYCGGKPANAISPEAMRLIPQRLVDFMTIPPFRTEGFLKTKKCTRSPG